MIKVFRLLYVSVLLILLLFPTIFSLSEASESKSALLVEKTDAAIKTAFGEVLDAETAGANVTDMVSALNQAAALLAQAENPIENPNPTVLEGNLSGIQVAYEYAEYVQTIARNAKVQALRSSQNSLLSTAVLSLIVAISFVLILSILWLRFKGNYKNRLLLKKPEVDNNEI
jgi:ABC-type transport system involved in multi-copper enzyme maturation permease subunit